MNSTGNIWKSLALLAAVLLWAAGIQAQTGAIKGHVTDSDTKEGMPSVRVTLDGTYYGALTDVDGNYEIREVKPGDYTVVIQDGSLEKRFTGITVRAGETVTIDAEMGFVTTQVVEIIGEGELIDIGNGKSSTSLDDKYIRESGQRDVQSLVAMQAGVNVTPDGLQIRGGRVYETTYLVEGISAKDPLSGTGFGVSVSAGSINELDITTGGSDAEFGNGTAGVINTKIKEGGNRLQASGSWFRDNLGFNPISSSSWNTDAINLNLSGPIRFRRAPEDQDRASSSRNKVYFFLSGDMENTDTYFGVQARQLHSSLFTKNDSFWAPRQDNRWGNTAKITWNIKPGVKFSVVNQHSLNINQNSRTLQIIGNDAVMQPGFPYFYSLNLDNGNTYTHHSNLTVANFRMPLDSTASWVMELSGGRLFTRLRADANGMPFRQSTVDRIYDPASIVTDPITLWNPNDPAVYVFPGPGLVNNGGIATLWHDHYAQEYTFRYKFTHQSENKVHFFSLGQEHKEQEYLWIDVTRPWVGAPIQINDSTVTPSYSVGSSSDVWKARPAQGGFFVQDEIKYKGLVAFLGLRLDYWAPGKFADDAVNNPAAPVVQEVRDQYAAQTFGFAGRRWKARLLPKVRVSFPVTDNNVLYFNYGHSTQLPHPRFVYAGLDPVYQDRGFLSNLGNPNINPEVTVAYEVGLKSMLNKNLALTVTAFYNDKFDYIVSRKLLIQDQTGRFVEKTFYINQDYARIRGIELGLNQRFLKTFRMQFSAGYQIATGKSNTAAESALQIKQQGFVGASKEQYLAWDRPFDAKLALFWNATDSTELFGIPLKGFRFFLSATWKSGLRYTPYVLTDTTAAGRPQYEMVVDAPYSKIGQSWFWTDFRLSKDFFFSQKHRSGATLSFEIKNLFNNKNSQIINGVTGRAYEDGDPLGIDYRDPYYPDPQDNGTPPYNPARYLQPRQFMFGITFKL